ncbi:hypothetical protein GW17_00049508 [Ensete ventricosum]|nr:hypothetical protein GW17_00049508 [Ensete ventricosum]
MSLPHSLPSIYGYPIHIAFDLWGRPFSLFPFSLLHYSRAFQPYVIVVDRTSAATPSPTPPSSGSKTVAQPYLILLELERAIVIVPRPVDHWRTLVMLLPVAPSTLSSLPLLHWQ